MNEKTLKGIIVVVLVLGGGGTTGAMLAMNENQVQYDALLADFQALTGDFNSLTTDHDGLLENYEALSESYDVLTGEYNSLNESYYALLEDYNTLVDDFNELNQTYNTLVADYNTLSAAYDTLDGLYSQLLDDYSQLSIDYQLLLEQYTTLTTWIRQQILPVQYMVFAEAVRRYYFEEFYVQNKWAEGNVSGYWTEFTRFCRDVIMHDSWEFSEISDSVYYNPFVEVSDALGPALQFDSVMLSFFAKWYNLWSAGQAYWWGNYSMTGDALTDIFNIVQECNYMIDYEYDTAITAVQDYAWDYIKFPVETLFRQAGDCEDQATLAAAYLESCGFETAMLVVHDEGNPQYDGFYHGALFVKLDNLAEYQSRYPGAFVWNMAWWDSSWDQGGVLIDTTWDVPFGTQPAWLQYYLDTYSLWSELTPIWSIAICDIDGLVTYPSTGTGTGLGVSMP